RDLLAHRREELVPRRLVEVLVIHQLEEPAEGEERRPQLVRRVRDELAPCIIELSQTETHAIERARELTELVQAVIDDWLVEAPRGDPVGRPLEPFDPARKRPRAAIADAKRYEQADEAGDEQAPLDDVNRLVLRRERRDEQNHGARGRNGDPH